MTIKQTSFCTFVLEFKNGTVVIDPVKKAENDILIYSIQNSGYLNYENETSLLVKNAGEFEIKDIFVTGKKNSGEDTFVYTVSADDVTIGIVSMTNEIDRIPVDFFESTDVLLIGAGAGPFLSAENANKLAQRVSPSVAVFFGFKEQAGKDLQNTLDSVEVAKKEIPGLTLSEKSLKLEKDYLDGLENTVSYYFEN